MTTNRQTRSDFFTKYKSKKNLEINEVWRLREILNNKYQGDILILLINKMLYFNNTNKLLNNDGEFYKPREEMKMDIGIAPDTITNNLKKLQKAGWLVFENKPIENNKFRWSLHFLLNIIKIENEILENGEVNLNDKYWELRGDYTPNNKTKAVKKSNPTIKPVVKPSENPTDELVEVTPIKSIEEPTKEIEEPTEPLNHFEDIRQDFKTLDENLDETKINKQKIKEMKNNNNLEMCEQARLLTKYKDKIGLKNVFHDLELTVEIVNYLYSSEYTEGADHKLDDKKVSVDVIINQMINPLRGLPMVFN